VLGEPARLEAAHERVQRGQMRFVQRRLAADRQADAVDRQRQPFAQLLEPAQARTAGDQVVLRMHLDEVHGCRALQQRQRVGVLQADAGQRRHGGVSRSFP
jgi:hypothetical protein